MKPVVRLLCLGLLCLPETAAGGNPVSLIGPEVYKLDWNTRSMVAADLDADGRADLAVLNNDRAKIDVLYQRKPGKVDEIEPRPSRGGRWEPLLEDSRFDRESIATGGAMYALAIGDLDGDGRSDLAFTGKPDPLTIIYQGKGRDWSRRRVLEIDEPVQWTHSIEINDLNADGRLDLAVLTRKHLLVYHQEPSGELGAAVALPLSDQGCFGLLVRDLDGDGRPYLTYLAPKSSTSWRTRFQQGSGVFGPERSFTLDTPATTLHPLELGPDSGAVFAVVKRQTRLLELLDLGTTANETLAAKELRPRIYATAGEGGSPSSYATGDYNGDGLVDVAAGSAAAAEVKIFLRREDGSLGLPIGYPTLPGVRSLAAGDMDGDGVDELLLVSPDEGALGVATLSAEGRLSYPSPLPTRGRPLAVAAGDLGGARDQIVYLYEDSGLRGVGLLPTDVAGSEEKQIEFADLRTNPDAVRILDANQDGLADLAIFIVQSPLRLLLQQRDGSFAEATPETGFQPGLVDKLRPAALTLSDVDGDGALEMLVAGRGFARALRVDQDGQLVVIDQFNARDGTAEISAAIAVDLDADKVPEILLAEKEGDALQVLGRDKQGVYRFRESIPAGRIDLVGAEVSEDERTGTELLVFGSDRFWWLPIDGAELRARSRSSHETQLERMSYTDLAIGDLNADGVEEIVVVDAEDSHLLEVLAPNDLTEWQSVLHFTVFESDPHYQGRRGANAEPREILISDLTSDGKADLALLVHDRVLIYPQE
jgi:hypothetical protein